MANVIYDKILGKLRESGEGGGEGNSDYNYLTNKPQINGVTLQGDMSGKQLGLVDAKDNSVNALQGKTFVTTQEEFDSLIADINADRAVNAVLGAGTFIVKEPITRLRTRFVLIGSEGTVVRRKNRVFHRADADTANNTDTHWACALGDDPVQPFSVFLDENDNIIPISEYALINYTTEPYMLANGVALDFENNASSTDGVFYIPKGDIDIPAAQLPYVYGYIDASWSADKFVLTGNIVNITKSGTDTVVECFEAQFLSYIETSSVRKCQSNANYNLSAGQLGRNSFVLYNTATDGATYYNGTHLMLPNGISSVEIVDGWYTCLDTTYGGRPQYFINAGRINSGTLHISGITFVGFQNLINNLENANADNAVRMDGISIKDCVFKKFTGFAVKTVLCATTGHYSEKQTSYITNCRFVDCGMGGYKTLILQAATNGMNGGARNCIGTGTTWMEVDGCELTGASSGMAQYKNSQGLIGLLIDATVKRCKLSNVGRDHIGVNKGDITIQDCDFFNTDTFVENRLRNFSSDGGFIYCYGADHVMKQNVVIKNNLFHGGYDLKYAGWFIPVYIDEGRTNVAVESNVIYNCQGVGIGGARKTDSGSMTFYAFVNGADTVYILSRKISDSHVYTYDSSTDEFTDTGVNIEIATREDISEITYAGKAWTYDSSSNITGKNWSSANVKYLNNIVAGFIQLVYSEDLQEDMLPEISGNVQFGTYSNNFGPSNNRVTEPPYTDCPIYSNTNKIYTDFYVDEVGIHVDHDIWSTLSSEMKVKVIGDKNIKAAIPAPATPGTENQILAIDAHGNPVWVNLPAGAPDDHLSETSTNTVQNKVVAAALAGKADTAGTYKKLIAGDLVSLGDRVTVAGKFIVRPTAADESIDSTADALLLQLVGGCGDVEAEAFKIHALQWNGTNQIDPEAWAAGKTSGYISGEVAQGTIGSGQHKLCIIHCPKCEVGSYGTAEKNNGYLLTNSEGTNLKVGDGTIIGVWHSETLPAVGTKVTAVTEHTFSGHPEAFYIPDEGYMIVEVAGNANLSAICAHMAWSKEYDKFTPYEQPNVLVLSVSPLTTAFETATINGDTCLVLRGIESGGSGIFDNVVIHAGGGGTYERNIAAQLLTGLTWTETEIETEDIETGETTVTGYRYTARLASTGTYAAMFDGLIRSDIEGMEIDGYSLVYESVEQITPATDFAGKYVDYQIATPVVGEHSINPTGKKPDDMGTEEVIGGGNPTGTIVISYMRGFRDTMRALYTHFKAASAELDLMKLHSPLCCVGEWLENAHTASPNDKDNPDALAVFGNREWALDWRPFLVDMTAVEGEVKKRPVMELRKNNWLRDIYGNFAPVVGITAAMRDECMTNALYSDNAGQNLYCAAGAYDPEAFLALCSIETVDGVKRLSHPALYKAVSDTEPIAYEEISHYLMPWETTETKYSIFVGRKDEVYLLDNLVGASGKEWNGIIASNVNFWDGVDVKVYALKPTGFSPAPPTSIVENNVSKLRSFFFNYNATDGYSKGTAGASGCTMFRNNGHYRTNNISQISTKNRARACNYVATNPFPVAEGGYHARNTFLRCVETALGTKNLCIASRFSSGVSSVDGCSNEATWLANGGIRYKGSGGTTWKYCGLDGNPAMYYGSGETKETANGSNWLSSYGPLSKALETQIALSFAVEFGIGAGERFEFNGFKWWYMNPTATGFSPATVADGYMNARVYKIVTGTFTGYSSANATETTDFDVEVCVRVGLMLGCDMSGDGGSYWGGGCEVIGECTTAPASGSFGYELKAYIEPDQTRWTNENDVSVNIGQKFSFESRYTMAGTIVTRSNGYTRRRVPNTPLPAVIGGDYQKGECGYSYMGNYWGAAGKKSRVGVRFGSFATNSYLSARFLNATYAAGNPYTNYCGSAQVLLDVQ